MYPVPRKVKNKPATVHALFYGLITTAIILSICSYLLKAQFFILIVSTLLVVAGSLGVYLHRSLLFQLQALEDNMYKAKPVQKKTLLQLLLQGAGKSPADSLAELNFTKKYYIVCMLRIDSFHSIRTSYTQHDISLFKYCMVNIADEISRQYLDCGVVEDQDDYIAVIVNADRPDFLSYGIESMIQEMQAHIRHVTKMTVTVSSGSVVDALEKVSESYREAMLASRLRIVTGTNTIIHYHDGMKTARKDDAYPYSIEKQLMDTLKLGDLNKLPLHADEFIHMLRPLPYDEIMLSLTQLVVMTLRTAKGMVAANCDEFQTAVIHSQLYQMDTLEDIQTWYLNMCRNIVHARDERADKKNEELIKKVVLFIVQHYHDSQLSIEMMAEMVGLSPNYLRKIFKNETNQTVANYITELRFQRAKELLQTTDYSANKIGELVGLPNNGYFYIAFKKYFGKTPIQYRTDSRHEADQQI